VKRLAVCIAFSLVWAVPVLAQRGAGRPGGRFGGYRAENLPQGNSEAERKILAVLDDAQRNGATYLNVSTADGRMLRLLAEVQGAKHVVELGTSTGVSGLWFCMALQKTGGRLTTFEYDAARAATARKHFAQAGVDNIVTVVEGDAHQTTSRLKEPIDILFIDADKEGYADYLNKLLPLVRPGGLILAHNEDTSPEYNRLVSSNPALETLSYREGAGMSITLKKR
jgi:predicted O-methyltransferase YrrM